MKSERSDKNGEGSYPEIWHDKNHGGQNKPSKLGDDSGDICWYLVMLHVRGMKCGQLKYLYEHWAWVVTCGYHPLFVARGGTKQNALTTWIGNIPGDWNNSNTKNNRESEGLDNMYIQNIQNMCFGLFNLFSQWNIDHDWGIDEEDP